MGRIVWLASYPKSGNTWLRAVYTAWMEDGPIDLDALHGGMIASSRVQFDAALGLPSSSMTPEEIELVRPRADEVLAADADGQLLRKIHDACFDGPAGEPIVSVAATSGALYVIRDPRDVAVSFAHHLGRDLAWAAAQLADPDAQVAGNDGALQDQLRQRLGTWSEHVRSWVDEAPFPVEVVRYEDCAAAPVETFTRALRFAGLDGVDEASVASAVERAGFGRLRAAEADRVFGERSTSGGSFFRRGEAGAWREELPPELAATIAADHADVMARFGYEPA
jgi:hypothetical protein